MNNGQVAYRMNEIANLMELTESNPFKIRAFRQAADSIYASSTPVSDLIHAGKLMGLPGIGKGTARVIEDFVRTGTSDVLEDLRLQLPGELPKMLQLPGVGPKTIKRFFQELGITTLDELESACKKRQIRGLSGYGPRTEENILNGIVTLRKAPDSFPIGQVLPLAEAIEKWIESLPNIIRINFSGDLRRMNEAVSAIEIIVATMDGQGVLSRILNAPWIIGVDEHLDHMASFSVALGAHPIRVEVRTTPPEQFVSLLHARTGSTAHIRRLIERSASIEEVTWTQNGFLQKSGAGFSHEEDLYIALGLEYITPELREDQGEVQAAANRTLPTLIELTDIRGDLHMHSTWSDGIHTIEQLADEARKMGYEYIAITDHSQHLSIARGLKPDQVRSQIAQIRKLNREYEGLHIYAGTEMDILPNSLLDFDDELLSELDWVIASIHSAFRQPGEVLTHRAVSAIQNRYVHLLAHPTGRLLSRRPGYPIDLEAVFQAASRNGTAIELNCTPNRLDLNDQAAKRANEYGVSIVINTDAHEIDELTAMRLGVATARRAWLTKADVVNAWSKEKLDAFLQSKKALPAR